MTPTHAITWLVVGLATAAGPRIAAGQAPTVADTAGRPVHARPVIVVVGSNARTELTDFLIPRAILAEADVGTVVTVAAESAPIRFNRSSLAVDPDLTLAAFDASHPAGADYIVVPNIMPNDDPVILKWLQRQAAQGATIVGVCDGVWTVANAGLLEGHRATGHWASLKRLTKNFPKTQWVWDQRYVSDGKIITTTGVTASTPVSLMLVARIGGDSAARRVAERIGVPDWGPTHDSHAFRFTPMMWGMLLIDQVAFWRHDEIAIPVADGVDEIALGLTLDAISRRATGVLVSESEATITGRQGLRFHADRTRASASNIARSVTLPAAPPASALDSTLVRMAGWYGERTAEFIAIQMEYDAPRR